MAQVHPVFHDALLALAEDGRRVAAAARGGPGRRWSLPPGAADPLDVPGTTAAFDRTAIGEDYAAALADPAAPGTCGDAVALNLQNDLVAADERAYRARHCTPIRLLAMAAARRGGHAHERGALQGGLLGAVTDALRAGGQGGGR